MASVNFHLGQFSVDVQKQGFHILFTKFSWIYWTNNEKKQIELSKRK